MKDALFSFGQCVSTVRYIVQTAGVLGTDSPRTGTGQSMSKGGGGERLCVHRYIYVCVCVCEGVFVGGCVGVRG